MADRRVIEIGIARTLPATATSGRRDGSSSSGRATLAVTDAVR